MKAQYLISLVLSGFIFLSCENLLDVDTPENYVSSELVYSNDQLAEAAVQGLYDQLFDGGYFTSGGLNSVSVLSGLSSDELLIGFFASGAQQEFYNNQILPSNSSNYQLWSSAYQIIYMVNSILQGLENSNGVTPESKKQFSAEASFVRAFTYFYLVNLFGEVPLITTTDYIENSLAARTSVEDVYFQILTDLEYARNNLTVSYIDFERTKPNALAATALLARVNLYLGNWSQAQEYASEVINSGLYSLQNDLNQVFLANSEESIWQIKPVNSGNTNEGNFFILPESPVSSFFYTVYLNNTLADAFESGDLRRDNWINAFVDQGESYYYPFKYKIRLSNNLPIEYSTVIRLSELYLIRSEAYVRQGDLENSLIDLNTIRNRAGLEDIAVGNQEELISRVLDERRKELFTEWGHRWLDMKRLNMAYEYLGALKPNWQTTDELYPIPEQEIDRAPNLSQNEGY